MYLVDELNSKARSIGADSFPRDSLTAASRRPDSLIGGAFHCKGVGDGREKGKGGQSLSEHS